MVGSVRKLVEGGGHAIREGRGDVNLSEYSFVGGAIYHVPPIQHKAELSPPQRTVVRLVTVGVGGPKLRRLQAASRTAVSSTHRRVVECGAYTKAVSVGRALLAGHQSHRPPAPQRGTVPIGMVCGVPPASVPFCPPHDKTRTLATPAWVQYHESPTTGARAAASSPRLRATSDRYSSYQRHN